MFYLLYKYYYIIILLYYYIIILLYHIIHKRNFKNCPLLPQKSLFLLIFWSNFLMFIIYSEMI